MLVSPLWCNWLLGWQVSWDSFPGSADTLRRPQSVTCWCRLGEEEKTGEGERAGLHQSRDSFILICWIMFFPFQRWRGTVQKKDAALRDRILICPHTSFRGQRSSNQVNSALAKWTCTSTSLPVLECCRGETQSEQTVLWWRARLLSHLEIGFCF